MANYTLEHSFQIYNDSTGEYVEVGTDADSLDLVEISSFGTHGERLQSVVMTPEQAKLVAIALNKYLAELEAANGNA